MRSATASRMSWCAFDIPKLEAEAAELETQAGDPAFWDDQQSAQGTMKRLASLRSTAETWRVLEARTDELLQLLELAEPENDEATAADIERDATGMERRLGELEFERTVAGPYDDRSAIIPIHAGAGGTEAAGRAAVPDRHEL